MFRRSPRGKSGPKLSETKERHTNLPNKADATEDTKKLEDQRTQQPSEREPANLGRDFSFLGKEGEL